MSGKFAVVCDYEQAESIYAQDMQIGELSLLESQSFYWRCTYVPATCKVAFLLTACPAMFLATHQYTPASCSFLLLIVLRKNNDPDNNNTRCDFDSTLEVRTGSPSLNHWISGSGRPSALQFKVTGSFFATILSEGCSVILGDRYCPEKERNLFILPESLIKLVNLYTWDVNLKGTNPWD